MFLVSGVQQCLEDSAANVFPQRPLERVVFYLRHIIGVVGVGEELVSLRLLGVVELCYSYPLVILRDVKLDTLFKDVGVQICLSCWCCVAPAVRPTYEAHRRRLGVS